ncbi:heterokaryon incompatibility protein [Neofusicoccum parvum]|nr:heterokaryon incompatibility protein [Neofusicoccum parvum]
MPNSIRHVSPGADPISHDTTLPRLARLNYDSLFELSHTRPIYPLAQVTNRSLETLLYDFEELNPPTIRPFHQTRKRTWDVLLEQFDTTTISPKTTTTPASRPIRSMRRAPTFPPPIPETVTRPPPPQQQQRQVKIVAPRQEHTTTTTTTPPTTPFPIRSSRAVHLPVHLFSARPGQPAAAVSALLDTRAELNFMDAGLAERLGATKLRYGGPDVAMPGGGGDGAALPAHGAVKARWRFDGRERSVVDAFVVLRGLPAEVVLGRAAVVARRWGVGDAEAEALGLPPLGRGT